jgi:hypothetical protein
LTLLHPAECPNLTVCRTTPVLYEPRSIFRNPLENTGRQVICQLSNNMDT